jgi:hypothetical protein
VLLGKLNPLEPGEAAATSSASYAAGGTASQSQTTGETTLLRSVGSTASIEARWTEISTGAVIIPITSVHQCGLTGSWPGIRVKEPSDTHDPEGSPTGYVPAPGIQYWSIIGKDAYSDARNAPFALDATG